MLMTILRHPIVFSRAVKLAVRLRNTWLYDIDPRRMNAEEFREIFKRHYPADFNEFEKAFGVTDALRATAATPEAETAERSANT